MALNHCIFDDKPCSGAFYSVFMPHAMEPYEHISMKELLWSCDKVTTNSRLNLPNVSSVLAVELVGAGKVLHGSESCTLTSETCLDLWTIGVDVDDA